MRWSFWFIIWLVVSCSSGIKKRELRTVFRYNETQGIATLDPAFARSQTLMRPVYQIYNRLLELDDSLQISPSLAKDYTLSKDGLRYTFFLRTDVFFQDSPVFPNGKGRKFIANDAVFSFRRLLDPHVASPGSWIFDYVDQNKDGNEFFAVNDSILTITLKKPFAAFPSLLTIPYCSIVPKEAIGSSCGDFRNHPVGTGPFMLKIWKEGEKMVLVKNPHYFEKDSTGRQLPYLDAIAITFINDKQSEFLEFMKGNLDFLSGVQSAYKDELLTRNGRLNPKYKDRFELITGPYLNTEYLGILVDTVKMKDNPLLDNRIRHAINIGFDRVKMIKYLRNNIGTPALYGFIPKGLPGYNDSVCYYAYQPDIARKLLSEAGYPDGKNLGTITLTTTSDYLDLCEYFQHELAQIGIHITIEVSTGATFREMVANSRVPLFRASWIADYPDAENYLSLFYSPNFSPNGPNFTHFSNTTYDRVMEHAITEKSLHARIAMYQKLNSIVAEENVVIPLYYDIVVRFIPKCIHGFGSNPMNILKLKYVYKDIPKQ